MYYQTKTGTPCAYITKDRKRLKQFGQNVYLNNGDEFELELFNPSTTTVLAKIKLDGSYISGGGIVLKPGQRVFLERYLDDPRKFKFETYEVDGTSNEVLDAIAGNGDVVIDFFDEYKQPVWNNPITYIGGTYTPPTYVNNPYNVNGGVSTFTTTNVNYSSSNTGGINFNTASSNSFAKPNLRSETSRLKKTKCNYSADITMDMLSTDSIETGRVEKGGSSDQSFQTVDKTFNHFSCATSIWKILPMSQKVYDKQELKVYCTNCGKKRKKDSDKFCSSCGNKF